MDQKITKAITLARKLRELWLRGDPHEKESAQDKLAALLKKHSLTIEDIEEEKMELRFFPCRQEHEELFIIIAMNIWGVEMIDKILHHPQRPGELAMELTNSQFIEMEAKFEFFLRAWIEDLSIFRHAFIIRQELFAADAVASKKEPEDKDYFAFLLSQEMTKRNFRVQIGAPPTFTNPFLK